MSMMYASALGRAGRQYDALPLYPLFSTCSVDAGARAFQSGVTHELMNTYAERGDPLVAMHRREEALADYRRALALGERMQPGNLRISLMVAATYQRLEAVLPVRAATGRPPASGQAGAPGCGGLDAGCTERVQSARDRAGAGGAARCG